MSKKKRKNILMGICSGIALYKSCSVVSKLVQSGYSVKVIMTEHATKLISPVVFSSLSRNKVYTDLFDTDWSDSHVSLAMWADMMVIAPLTANTLSKIAHGIADDLLTTSVLALPESKPLLLFSSMNDVMWCNQITQENVRRLRNVKRKQPVTLVEPEKGRLACGTKNAIGRLPEPETIFNWIEQVSGY